MTQPIEVRIPMSSQFPDTETVRSALMLAVRAPSVHNSQPWAWRVGAHSIHLHANEDLALPHTDPDARDLLMSCGATLNHAQIAFAALGWQAKVHRLPDPAEPNHLAVLEFHRYPPTESDIVLAAAIPVRRTDRRNYSSWPVPQGDIAMMGARAARAGVMLRRFDELTTLKRRVMEAEGRHNDDPAYLAELAEWSGRYGSTAGVPARNTPPPDPRAAVPARSFAGAVLKQPVDAAEEQDNAVVIALGTVADDRVSALRAGEATGLVLLTATAAGLASCPITGPLEIPDIRAAVGEDVFGSGGHAQMLLRIGWAPVNADPLPSTPAPPAARSRDAVGRHAVRLARQPQGVPMQTFTFGLGLWFRRLLTRHPLVRLSDRIEAASLLLILVVALLAVPVAGAAGTAVHDDLVHSFAAQRAERQQIEATVLRDSRPAAQAYENPYVTPIQWQFNGATHTADVRTPKRKAGEHVSIWIDSGGNRTPQPPTDHDAAVQAVIAAMAVWSMAVGSTVTGWAVLRLRLDRSRYSAWDRDLDDLADNGGRTNKNA